MNRPELKVLKPRSLKIACAKCGTIENVEKYFESLEEDINKYGLQNKPHLIFNVNEKGLTSNHKPSNVVSGIEWHTTSAVTSGKSSTTTAIGCGNASRFAVPPYFVFKSKRMMDDLINGAMPGAAGTVSETGWSNTKVFKQYLSNHFLNFIPGRNDDPVLLLLDGHKSHVAVDIIEWAQERSIILHILPAHTSHILQPLDVGCYGPLQRIYDNECHKTMRQNHSIITRYNVCELGCKAYQRALSPENLQSAFRKTGIYPLTMTVINRDLLKPSKVFKPNDDNNETKMNIDDYDDTTVLEPVTVMEDEHHDLVEDSQVLAPDFFNEKIIKLKEIKSETNKKKKNTLGKIVSGRSITETTVAEQVKQHVEYQRKKKPKDSKPGRRNRNQLKMIHAILKRKARKERRISHKNQAPAIFILIRIQQTLKQMMMIMRYYMCI